MIPPVHPPSARHNEERSAFARGPKERKLRVLVDRATTPAGDMLDLLLEFGDHPLVDLLSTRAEGLSHLDIGPIDTEDDQAPVVISHRGGTQVTYTGVWPASNLLRLADNLLRTHPTITDQTEVVRVLLLASAAEDYGADVLATGSPILVDPTKRPALAQRSNAMSVAEAVALLGLHLRLRNSFTYGRSGQGYRVDLGRLGFYWVLARELLPSAWRCGSGAQQYGQAIGDDRVFQLVMSTIKRLGNSLRARDRLHGQIMLVQNNDTANEAQFYLDTFLVFMVSAFDAVGRAAHLVHGLDPNKLHQVSWRADGKDRWRIQQLQPVAPALANLMAKGTHGRDALDLLAILRNTVHGEALQTAGVHHSGRPLETVLLLPTHAQGELLAIMARRGGNDLWGVRQSHGLGMSMRMDRFIEAVLPMAVDALDTLIKEVSGQIDKLPGVHAVTLPSGPPADGPSQLFHSSTRRRVRLLAGL